jgi:hypothetical protein
MTMKESRFKKIVMALACLTPAWGLILVFVAMVYVSHAQTIYKTEAKLGDKCVPITVMTGKRIMVPGAVFGPRELSMQKGKVVSLQTVVARGRPLINVYVDATPAEAKLYREIFLD